MKNWLLDYNTDAEKLNLILPGIVLKCDTVECLINPLMLPCGNNYQLQPTAPPAFSYLELAGEYFSKVYVLIMLLKYVHNCGRFTVSNTVDYDCNCSQLIIVNELTE